jgi:CHAT domain
MSRKDTRATGPGSVAIGGSATGSTISTNVLNPLTDQTNRRLQSGKGNSVSADGPGSIAVGANIENSRLETNVALSTERSALTPDLVKFPQLETPVDVILRIAHTGLEEIRFDALTKDGHQVGPYGRRIGPNPGQFAAKLSDIGRDAMVSEGQQAARLRAIGLEIADLIPKELLEGPHAALGAALTKKGAGPSLLILTDEAFIPWELARLSSSGGTTAGERYLGEATRVGRWPINETFPTPRAALELGEFHVVVASSYEKTGSRRDLPHAVAEAQFVVDRFGAKWHEATGTETSAWLASPRSGAETLLLAMHGYSDPKANEQRLVLGDGQEITSHDLLGVNENNKPRPYSLVFINACQAGSGGQSLAQVSGFPGTLTRRGTGAVIAPLWEVDDAEACELAKNFFTKALNDEMEVGGALKSLRHDAGRPGITRFAYIFYGHPLLKLHQG